MPKVGFYAFDRERSGKTGSSRIRVDNLCKYHPDFENAITGKKYDVVVFQKYYWHDYAKAFPGIKILDICDPDWLTGTSSTDFVRMLTLVDGVACNTEATAKYIRKLTDKPVVVIPDRHDMSLMKQHKIHTGRAKSVVWFGYSHNAEVLRPYIMKLEEHGLELTIIAEKFLRLASGSNYQFADKEHFVQWPSTVEEVNEELIKHDIALLPARRRPQEQYKSNNKDTHAMAVGLPVAHWGDEVDGFIEAESRIAFQKEHMEATRRDYDCKKSVQEYLDFIALLEKLTSK